MMRKNNKTIDVLLVGSYPPPHGGQSVHIQQLMRYLKHEGLRAAVVNTGSDKTINDSGILSVRSSAGLLRAVLFGFKAEVVHVHTARVDDFGKLVPVFLASFVRRFRWVVTIHSGNITAQLNGAGLFTKILRKIVLPRIDRIISVNDVTKHALCGVVGHGRATVISAFSVAFSEVDLPRKIEEFLGTHHPLLCATGFYEQVYGFELAIRGLTELKRTYKNIGLVLIANRINSRKYEDMIEEYGLRNDILLCGDIPHDKCLSIFSRASLFLRPTLYDGDSLSVKEALALGVPVVASRTEFRPEGVVTFRINDVRDMIEKVEGVLQGVNTRGREFRGSQENLEEVKSVYLSLTRKRRQHEPVVEQL
jgi:glycogen(starch) synthase